MPSKVYVLYHNGRYCRMSNHIMNTVKEIRRPDVLFMNVDCSRIQNVKHKYRPVLIESDTGVEYRDVKLIEVIFLLGNSARVAWG